MKPLAIVVALALLFPPLCHAQESPYYSRLNTFSGYVEYSDTSSHIEWGVSRRRKLASLGGSYARRFNAPHWFNWTPHASVFYEIEASPVNFLQDPVATYTFPSQPNSQRFTYVPDTVCQPGAVTFPGDTYAVSCGTRWTYMGGLAPVGFRVNFGPKRKLQPFIDSHLGFLVASRDVPVLDSLQFNFTFEFGTGLELYQSSGKSLALEYRLHHLSNAEIGDHNPGVDSQIVKLTYSFGKLRR